MEDKKYWLLSTMGERHEDRLPIKIFETDNLEDIKQFIVKHDSLDFEFVEGDDVVWNIEKSKGDYGMGYLISVSIKGYEDQCCGFFMLEQF